METRARESWIPSSIALVDFRHVRAARSWFIGLGVVFVLLGLLAVVVPFAATMATTMLIGWLMLIGGLFQGAHALRNRRWGGSGWALASAAVGVIGGGLVIAFPLAGTLTLTLILAGFFVAEGALKIVRALQHRGMPAWGFLLLDGAVALGLGLMIAVGWPSTAVWALGLLVGINFVFGGVSLLLIGAGARPTAPV
jgi:uncharacterized membrane protein HdeD (DUF308 family)